MCCVEIYLNSTLQVGLIACFEVKNPNVASWFQEGRLDGAIEALLDIEKQLRLSANVVGTRRLVVAIIQLCYDARAWKTLNEQIILLSKRRAQLKQVRTSSFPRFIT